MIPTLVAVSVAPTKTATSTGRERHRHAHQGNQRRLGTSPQQVAKIGLQTYLEEQDQDPEFGQGVKRLGLVDKAKEARADDHSGQQFTQDRRLADALHRLACHLRGQPDEDEAQEQVTQFHGDAFSQR